MKSPLLYGVTLGFMLGFWVCGFVNWSWPLPEAPALVQACSPEDPEQALWDLILRGDENKASAPRDLSVSKY